MAKLKLLIDKKQIASKIVEFAKQIDRDYTGKDLVILMVLKGAICLVADLIRALDIPTSLEVVQCKSYGARGKERGDLRVLGLDALPLEGRDILIVDDIFDSGHTLSALTHAVKEKNPRSVKSLVLLSKKVPHVPHILPDYTLFEIENYFVVGYGLDYKEHYRGLANVSILELS